MFFFYLAILLPGHFSKDMIAGMPEISDKTTGSVVHNVAKLEKLTQAGLGSLSGGARLLRARQAAVRDALTTSFLSFFPFAF